MQYYNTPVRLSAHQQARLPPVRTENQKQGDGGASCQFNLRGTYMVVDTSIHLFGFQTAGALVGCFRALHFEHSIASKRLLPSGHFYDGINHNTLDYPWHRGM